MKLYRGMSDLEFYCWLDGEKLPRSKNFTTDPTEAINFGKRYVLSGDLIIFSMDYVPENFNSILLPKVGMAGWYQTNQNLSLQNKIFEIYSPSEAVDDYQKRIYSNVVPLVR